MSDDRRIEVTTASPVPRQIACGWNHTILVSESGFFGFGSGKNGELGHELGFVKYQAAQLKLAVPAPRKPRESQVAAGAKHTVICQDGAVYTTGSPDNGRLGHSQAHGRVSFGDSNVNIGFVAVGSDHTIAVSIDGTQLYTWGLCTINGAGGVLTDTNVDHHQQQQSSSSSPSSSSSSSSSPSISTPTIINKPLPFSIISSLGDKKRIFQVSCGSRHTLALSSDGEVYSWGIGRNGRLGHGGETDQYYPTVIQRFITSSEQSIIQLCAGDGHSLALNREGRVFSWGSGAYGRLGLGTEYDQYVPTLIEHTLKDKKIISISCNSFHSVAVGSKQGQIYTWGDGKYGKLGHDNETNAHIPTQVLALSAITVWRVACGLQHTVCVTSENHVYAFGYAAQFRCGLALPPQQQQLSFLVPQQISFFDDKMIYKNHKEQIYHSLQSKFKATYVSAGESHSLALCKLATQTTNSNNNNNNNNNNSNNNCVVTWGSNEFGQMGTGRQLKSGRPVIVSLSSSKPLIGVKQVECGSFHSIIVTVNGDVYTWGLNNRGQLGTGDQENRIYPELLKALQGTPIHSVSAGFANSMAIARKLDMSPSAPKQKLPKVFAWGDNNDGQCGIGRQDIKAQLYPVPVCLSFQQKQIQKGSTRIIKGFDTVQVALGKNHSIFCLTDTYEVKENHPPHCSRVYVCGKGKRGQLGLAIDLNKPVYIPSKVREWEDDEKITIDRRKKLHYNEVTIHKDNEKIKQQNKEIERDNKDNPNDQKPLIPEKTEKMKIYENCEEDEHFYENQYEQQQDASTRETSKEEEDDDDNDTNTTRTTTTTGGGGGGGGLFNIFSSSKSSSSDVTLLPRYPNIVKVYAGPYSSLAVEWHETFNPVFAWGYLPGLVDTNSSILLNPKFLQYFTTDGGMANEVDSTNTIYNFNVLDVSLSGTHGLLLAECNSKSDNRLVFTWGETRYGKLGVGNIPEHLEDRKKMERMREQSGGVSKKETFASASSISFLSPRLMETIAGIDRVSSVATKGDHCIAASSDSGCVWSWGFGDSGRLGLSDGANDALTNLSSSVPLVLPAFKPHNISTNVGSIVGDDDNEEGSASNSSSSSSVGGLSTKHLADRKMVNKDEVTNLTREYNEHRKKYIMGLKERERNMDLLHLVIKQRAAESQNRDNSVTARYFQLYKDVPPPYMNTSQNDIMPHSSILTPLEELVSRIYQRPCLLYRALMLYNESITHFRVNDVRADVTEQISESLKADCSDLIFSLYDTRRDTDIRLLKVFLKQMIQQHCSKITYTQHLLKPDSLEWMIFLRSTLSTKTKRKIANTLTRILMSDQVRIINKDRVLPSQLLASFVSPIKGGFDPDSVNEALSIIRQASSDFISHLIHPDNFVEIFELLVEPLELFYSSLGGAHPYHPIFTSRLMLLLAEIMIGDQAYQMDRIARELVKNKFKTADTNIKTKIKTKKEILKETKNESNARAKGQSIPQPEIKKQVTTLETAMTEVELLEYKFDAYHMVLLHLKSLLELQEYIREKYSIPTEFFGETITAVKKGTKEIEKISTTTDERVRESNIEKLREFEYYMNHTKRERIDANKTLTKELYRDYMYSRSIHTRRIVQIPSSCLRFLIDEAHSLFPNMSDYKLDELRYDGTQYQQGDLTKVNIRLDCFNVDFGRIEKNCQYCRIKHPLPEDLNTNDNNKNNNNNNNHHKNKKQKETISTDECIALYEVLKVPEMETIIRHVAGQACWKQIDDKLSEARQNAAKENNQSKTRSYEAAVGRFRMLKEFKESQNNDIVIYFGGDNNSNNNTNNNNNNNNSSKFVLADQLEPSLLLDILSSIAGDLRSEIVQEDNLVSVLKLTNKDLSRRCDELINPINGLNKRFAEEFFEMTREHQNIDLLVDDSNSSSKTALSHKDRNLLKNNGTKYREIQVYLERGGVIEYSYRDMVESGLLALVGIDPTHPSMGALCSYNCISSCYSCQELSTKKKISFLNNLLFTFSTTDTPDSIMFKLMHHGHVEDGKPHVIKEQQSNDMLLNTNISLRKLVNPNKEEDQNFWELEYSPTGDRVAIEETIKFQFPRKSLSDKLMSLPRPRSAAVELEEIKIQ